MCLCSCIYLQKIDNLNKIQRLFSFSCRPAQLRKCLPQLSWKCLSSQTTASVLRLVAGIVVRQLQQTVLIWCVLHTPHTGQLLTRGVNLSSTKCLMARRLPFNNLVSCLESCCFKIWNLKNLLDCGSQTKVNINPSTIVYVLCGWTQQQGKAAIRILACWAQSDIFWAKSEPQFCLRQ